MTKRPTKEEFQRLLERYGQGKCTEKEMEMLNQWYDSFEDSEAPSDVADQARLRQLKAEIFAHINQRIATEETSTLRSISLAGIMRIAAVLVLAVGITWFLSDKIGLTGERTDALSDRSDEPASHEPRLVSGPATIYLSDGSVVWLHANSEFEYPETFTANVREVNLTGEAFFDVARDGSRPFIIHSDHFTTRVLGTTFKIKDFAEADSQEVEVVTGEVKVSVKGMSPDSAQEVILKPKRKAVYSRKDNLLTEYAADDSATQDPSLSRSKLAFNEVSLRDIVRVLNATYDVDITIANPKLNNCIITADLTHETLDVSVAILSKAINAEVTTHGSNIVLSGEGCSGVAHDSHPHE